MHSPDPDGGRGDGLVRLVHNHVGTDGLVDAMRLVLAGAAGVLRPGGVVALTVRPRWPNGELVDLPSALTRVGQAAGLILFERNIALPVVPGVICPGPALSAVGAAGLEPATPSL